MLVLLFEWRDDIKMDGKKLDVPGGDFQRVPVVKIIERQWCCFPPFIGFVKEKQLYAYRALPVLSPLFSHWKETSFSSLPLFPSFKSNNSVSSTPTNSLPPPSSLPNLPGVSKNLSTAVLTKIPESKMCQIVTRVDEKYEHQLTFVLPCKDHLVCGPSTDSEDAVLVTSEQLEAFFKQLEKEEPRKRDILRSKLRGLKDAFCRMWATG